MADSTQNTALTSLQQELEEVLLRRRRASRLSILLASTEDDLRRRETELDALRKQLGHEHADVQRLEGLSFTAILWTVLQRKEEQLEKEQHELAVARLKYDAARAEVQALREERQRLSSELAGLADVESSYVVLTARKEQLLLQLGDERAQRLSEVVDRLFKLRSEVKELKEAESAAQAAVAAIWEVRKALGAAAGWGQWDLWAGGDLLSSSIKHNHLDNAKIAAQVANTKINQLRRELRDTQLSIDSGECVEPPELNWFFDVFVDNFFTDWCVQNGIDRANEATEQTLAKVTAATVLITRDLRQAQAELSSTEQARTGLLEAGV